MNRTGDAEPSCPVLPEAMVTKMDEVCEPDLKGWDFMRERLKALVSMQRLWGDIGDLYKGSMESLYTQEVLPPFVRGPDSKWTRRWCVPNHPSNWMHGPGLIETLLRAVPQGSHAGGFHLLGSDSCTVSDLL